MDSNIEFGMLTRVVSRFSEGWAGNHDAGRADSAFVQGNKSCAVHGMAHAQIIGMNDEQLGINRESENLGSPRHRSEYTSLSAHAMASGRPESVRIH